MNHQKPILGINPGSSYGNAKRWYPQEFSEVIAALSNKYDITILGGPDEIEIAMDIQRLIVKKGVSNYMNLAGKLSISELINQISKDNLDVLIYLDIGMKPKIQIRKWTHSMEMHGSGVWTL